MRTFLKAQEEIISKYIYVSLFAVALGFMLQVAYAWVEPTLAPPGANTSAPLNESNVGQEKIGGLLLNTGGAGTGLIVDKGSVGIGTQNPLAKLSILGNIQIKDGSEGVGKVLTSDANGVANWLPSATVGGGSGVPSGAVMSFNLSSCPTGWMELPDSRGRYVVSGAPGTRVGTPLTLGENRPTGRHKHQVMVSPAGTLVNNLPVVGVSYPATGYTSGDIYSTNESPTKLNIPDGTNAPYITLLMCQKQ